MWEVSSEGTAFNAEHKDTIWCRRTFEVVLCVGDNERILGRFTDSNTAKSFLAKYARTLNGLETLANDLNTPTLKALNELKEGE